ncbi:MAG TPA: hypothetical protein VER14_08445 [Phototrophicaceae bacterium]|nr:hypothetical protein [Phototrophicaceae bacterium]
MAKESGIAKSIGKQTENDMKSADQLLYNYLKTGKKISKTEAGYREQQQHEYLSQKDREQQQQPPSCDKCKFNLPAEQVCHIVEGNVNNDKGISDHFSPRGHGMLPGDIVWDYVKKSGEKLDYNTGRVIKEATDGFKCKDCKYYMYSHRCLLLKGRLEPEMSCAFIVKTGNGIEV